MQATAHQTVLEPANDLGALFIKAPGTCGELLQGAIDGQDFLVNCPINLFSYAKVQRIGSAGLQLQHEHRYTKIRDTILLAAEEHEFSLNHALEIDSNIPRGKGMASSSADISAAFEAICRSSDLSLTAEAFAHTVTEVEPSDLVHFPGVSHINHLTGQLFESMPAPEEMSILVIDCGGHIDTVMFDRIKARSLYRSHQPALCAMLKLLKTGLYTNDLAAVAKAATQSAKFNQQIHFKSQFEDLLAISLAAGALGVNCAHSGTVLGVMYRSNELLEERLINGISKYFGNDINIIGNHHMISGGCYEY